MQKKFSVFVSIPLLFIGGHRNGTASAEESPQLHKLFNVLDEFS